MSQTIIEKLDLAMSLLNEIRVSLLPAATDKVPAPQVTPDYSKDFEELKQLLNSPDWPEAVPSEHICTETETDKQDRAEGILELFIGTPLTDKSFLDCGCGEGHIVKKAVEQGAAKAVGYDLAASGPFEWETSENGMLTTDFKKVEALGPFDYILLYDVLDHYIGPNMNLYSLLSDVRKVLKPSGKIHLRCHPWTGRHGGHLYKEINKAFVHFIFTKDELKELGYALDPNILTLLHPEGTYRWHFEKANLKISGQSCARHIDNFFIQHPVLQRRINELYANSIRKGWSVEWGQEFCDYILIPS